LDGGKEVLVDVDVHFVGLEEEFVDLEEAAKAINQYVYNIPYSMVTQVAPRRSSHS